MNQANIETQAYWIWYPGDWEIWLHEQVSVKRQMRGVIYPAYWRLDRHYSNVIYTTSYELEDPEEIIIKADGQFAVYLDGQDNVRFGSSRMLLPAGKHDIHITVYNSTNVPALYVDGEHIKSNNSWQVSCFDQRWYAAGSWKDTLNDPAVPPSQYRMPTEHKRPLSVERTENGWFVDFGKETFGYLQLDGIRGRSNVNVYYGESKEEAEDTEHSVLVDRIDAEDLTSARFVFPESRAFRYVHILPEEPDFELESVSMHYEYLPVEYRASFTCSNERLNEIWQTSQYTFHLNTREFFYDGIKRDRWVWSGDAYQSFLMNYYSFFDRDVVKRTLIALRGKDPVVAHMNTILDYSLYWFIGIYDYYLYTGDEAFVRAQYERMVSLFDFCLSRRGADGMMEGIGSDWVFVDWADLDNRGEVSTIQLLLCRSLQAMSLVAELVGDVERAPMYRQLAEELKAKIIDIFWDETKGGLLHNRYEGKVKDKMTKYPNMFALLFGYLDESQVETVKRNVLLNPDVQSIKTPYMRFYELAALCEIGEHEHVLREILDYWGGMLDLGATSFWEEYDPNQSGREHYAMYGMRYGKSLCHAWGASPLYLLGKYFIGVRPESAGYEQFVVEPHLGGLEWMQGTMPTASGHVELYMDQQIIKVRATHGEGRLRYMKDGRQMETLIPVDGSWLEVAYS